MLAPALHLQIVHYNPEKEVDKVMRKYRELREKGELPQQKVQSKKKTEHYTQQQGHEEIRVREIWKNIKALFSR